MVRSEAERFSLGLARARGALGARLSLIAVLAGITASSCSAGDVTHASHSPSTEDRRGALGLNLVPVSGITLNSIHYLVTNSRTPPAIVAEGDLPTAGSARDIAFGLSLPVGAGYKVSFSAASAETGDDVTCSGAFGPFDVFPNANTNISATLTCIDNTSGQILADVAVVSDGCPHLVIDYVVATPSAAFPGSKIALASHAHDLDGKQVSYSWQFSAPTQGTLSSTTTPVTELLCLGNALNATVTMTASNGECTRGLQTTVSCRDLVCGNGVIDPGETCDLGIPGSVCTPTCNSVCGNHVVEPPVEACEPNGFNDPFCDFNCHVRGECGDGFLSPPEVCDGNQFPTGAPACSVCSADCSRISVPVCGDGFVATGCEQCDDGGSSPLCTNTCTKVSSAACVGCEQAGDCFEYANNCLGPTGNFTAAQQTQCYAVMSCVQATNCLDGTGSLGKCYCGSLTTAACANAPFELTQAGAPNGPCARVIQAGMPGVTTNTAVLGGLTASARPAGAAMQRLSCEKFANNSECLDDCGFTVGGPSFP